MQTGNQTRPSPCPPTAASNEKKSQLLSRQTVVEAGRELQSAARVQMKGYPRLGVGEMVAVFRRHQFTLFGCSLD